MGVSVAVFLFILGSPIILFNGCLALGTMAAMSGDAIKGPYQLEKPVSLVSPDGKTRFESDTTGKMRLVEVKSGRVLHTHRISLSSYRSVEATWREDGDNVYVDATIRYPAMALSRDALWNRKTGAFTDPYTGKPTDF